MGLVSDDVAAPDPASSPPGAGLADGPAPTGVVASPSGLTRPLDGTSREFLLAQTHALGPFEFLVLASPASPLEPMEIAREESGALMVRVPPRLTGEALPVPVRSALVARGFRSRDAASARVPWEHPVASPGDAVDLAIATLAEVLDVPVGEAIDIAHGSHRAEHELAERLVALRERLEPTLTDVLGRTPVQDEDGDYLVPVDGVQVIVAPRAVLGAPLVLRVFTITNVGVTINAELGLFLARLNFGLMFGRFALDTEHQAVWFDETLLGEETSDTELRFAVRMVAATAADWAPKLQKMFDGATQEDLRKRAEQPPAPSTKPGQGGYL
jgi:hypothetical protein